MSSYWGKSGEKGRVAVRKDVTLRGEEWEKGIVAVHNDVMLLGKSG